MTEYIMRIRFKRQGGHTHLRIFLSKGMDFTFANCGDLVLTNEEFDALRMNQIDFEYVEES